MPSRRIPPDQRKRTEMSCDKCKARKQKCHRPLAAPPPPAARPVPFSSASAPSLPRDDPRQGPPCRYCQTHNHACVTTQPRKKRGGAYAPGPEGAPGAARAALLEALVKGLVPDADTASVEGLRALGLALGISLPPEGDGAAEDAPGESDPGAGDDDLDVGPDDLLGAGGDGDEAATAADGLLDCAGQTQYVGPSSSYVMQLRVRAMLTGVNAPARFFLFAGSSAGAEEETTTRSLQPCAAGRDWGTDPSGLLLNDTGAHHGISADADALAGPIAESLIAAYFANIHPLFPVLDEAAFRAAYADFLLQGAVAAAAAADPAWLCSLYSVFLLAHRFAPAAAVPPERVPDAEAAWWRRARALLPTVLLASRPAAVQALLLAAAHLNNANRRDACWTLTGAAARIAVAVGLHRHHHHHQRAGLVSAGRPDGFETNRPHLETLWWTLYHFELLQAASLDRPSALDEATAPSLPPQALVAAPPAPDRALALLLARACRLARTGPEASTTTTATGPRAPTTALLADLAHWRAALPPDLLPDRAARLPPGHRPPSVLRLHVEYQHVLCVAARGALLRQCTTTTTAALPPPPPEDPDLAAVAVRAARDSLDLLLALDQEAGALDAYAAWDLYFLYQAVLVLGLHVASPRGAAAAAAAPAPADSDVGLLQRAARVAARVEADPRVPGTMRRYAVVICEVGALVQREQQQQLSASSTKGAGEEEEEEVKWPGATCEAEGGVPPALMPPPPPSQDDVLGVMSQVSFPMPSAELVAQFGLVDGGFWMGPREGWGDFMGFGT